MSGGDVGENDFEIIVLDIVLGENFNMFSDFGV